MVYSVIYVNTSPDYFSRFHKCIVPNKPKQIYQLLQICILKSHQKRIKTNKQKFKALQNKISVLKSLTARYFKDIQRTFKQVQVPVYFSQLSVFHQTLSVTYFFATKEKHNQTAKMHLIFPSSTLAGKYHSSYLETNAQHLCKFQVTS